MLGKLHLACHNFVTNLQQVVHPVFTIWSYHGNMDEEPAGGRAANLLEGFRSMSHTSNESAEWHHPLITPYQPRRFDRRRLLVMTTGGIAAAASIVPLRAASGQESSPETAITGEADARDLLEQAVRAMAELETFAFEIETVAGETALMPGLSLGLVEGAVRRPNDFTATVEVSTPIGTIALSAVGLGNQAWIENPLSDGEWMSLEGIGDVSAILNPDILVLAAVNVLQDARLDGTEKVGGLDTTRIAGVINLAEAASLVDEAAGQISSEPLDVLIWIDDDHRIAEIELAGPILSTEDASVIRSIRFFDFDEPVDIEEPPV